MVSLFHKHSQTFPTRRCSGSGAPITRKHSKLKNKKKTRLGRGASAAEWRLIVQSTPRRFRVREWNVTSPVCAHYTCVVSQ